MKFGGLRILREDLAGKIIDFCISNNLFSAPELENVSVDSLEKQLEYKAFVEHLVQLLISKVSTMQHADLIQLQELLVELSKISIELDQNQ